MAQTFDNVTTVTADSGQQTASASVAVSGQPVNPPTVISTGLTNYLFLDSFFIPLVIALVGVWLYKNRYIALPAWAGSLQRNNQEKKAQQELQQKIAKIKQEADKA